MFTPPSEVPKDFIKKASFCINIDESNVQKTNNSVAKVKLKDTRQSQIYRPLKDLNSLSSSNSEQSFIQKYSNESALNISEDDNDVTNHGLEFYHGTSMEHPNHDLELYGGIPNFKTPQGAEELEKNEEVEEYFDASDSIPKNNTVTPPIIPKARPPHSRTIFNVTHAHPIKYGRGGSSVWMSSAEDARHECSEKCYSPLHEAVNSGNVDEIEMLMETGANPNAKDCTGRTPLHWAVNSGCTCDACTLLSVKCTQALVDSPRTDIDIQDNNGETALHLAAENQSTKCASILLYSGADHSIKSKPGVKALSVMIEKIPEAMDSLLNRAVSIGKYDPSNIKCELKLDFGSLIGLSEARSLSQRTASAKEALEPNNKNGNVWNPKTKKEMQLLTLILDCSSSARKKLLTHPIICIFLHLKWMKIKSMLWATILLHVLLLLLYTVYILDVYLISCPYRPKITEPAAVKAAKAEGNFVQNENSTYRAEFIKFSWFEFSPQLQELGTIKSDLYEGCPLEIGPTVKSVLLLVLTIIMVANEIFKMLPAPKSYWKRVTNRMTWAMFFFIFINSWPVFMDQPNINFWQYQAAAFGLFLAWTLMLTQIGKFPLLGLYVEILTKVLKNFGFFMITYASLLIAFALSFCVLFPGNAPYSSIPLAILKVLMMMVGEVNYEDLFYGNEENPVDDLLYPITGHILYGAFVIMITIVLMNLLVGLTVSDIQGLQREAELKRLQRQIGEISQLESFVFSKRVQSFMPRAFAAFLRDSILVVPTNEAKDGGWFFTCRPNDPNDKSIPEDLKLSLIKLAASRHRNKRTNRCSRIVNRINNFEDCALASNSALNGRKASIISHYKGLIDYGKCTEVNKSKNPTNSTTVPLSSTTNQDHWSGDQLNMNLGDANELMKRFEETIMDRMKIQMDALFQKLEDRMMQ